MIFHDTSYYLIQGWMRRIFPRCIYAWVDVKNANGIGTWLSDFSLLVAVCHHSDKERCIEKSLCKINVCFSIRLGTYKCTCVYVIFNDFFNLFLPVILESFKAKRQTFTLTAPLLRRLSENWRINSFNINNLPSFWRSLNSLKTWKY